MKTMDTLEAIQYLCAHAATGSEWKEAGMWNAVQDVVSKKARRWSEAALDALIRHAEAN